jgi:hypothetical protein
MDLRAQNIGVGPKGQLRIALPSLDRSRPIWAEPGVWTVSFDCLHAYNHVSLAPKERRSTAVAWGTWPEGQAPVPGAVDPPRDEAGRLIRFFEFDALPFGGTASACAFQRVMEVVRRHVARQGLAHSLVYIDDWAFSASSYREAAQISRYVRALFARLGLTINVEKSVAVPTQVCKILGLHVDTRPSREGNLFRVPPRKACKIHRACAELLAKACGGPQWGQVGAPSAGQPVRVREVARVTGKLIACRCALGQRVRRRTRALYTAVAEAVRSALDSAGADYAFEPARLRRALRCAWGQTMRLNDAVKGELRYWLRFDLDGAAAPIWPYGHTYALDAPPPTGLMIADTGETGFGGLRVNSDGDGATSGLDFARGRLSAAEARASSTVRELLGILRTLQAFAPTPAQTLTRINFLVDSQCAVRALDFGSMTPEVQRAAEQVWSLAEARRLDLCCLWLRRSFGPVVVADRLAALERRSKAAQRSDYHAPKALFDSLTREFGAVDVDVMATAESRQCAKYIARYVEVEAGTKSMQPADAFAWHWGDLGRVWCYCPWAILARTLEHARATQARGIFLVPHSPEAVWWPLVQEGYRSGAGKRWRKIRAGTAGLTRPDGSGGREPARAVDEQGRPCHLLAFDADYSRRERTARRAR